MDERDQDRGRAGGLARQLVALGRLEHRVPAGRSICEFVAVLDAQLIDLAAVRAAKLGDLLVRAVRSGLVRLGQQPVPRIGPRITVSPRAVPSSPSRPR